MINVRDTGGAPTGEFAHYTVLAFAHTVAGDGLMVFSWSMAARGEAVSQVWV